MLSKHINGIREISNTRKKFESYISLFTGEDIIAGLEYFLNKLIGVKDFLKL